MPRRFIERLTTAESQRGSGRCPLSRERRFGRRRASCRSLLLIALALVVGCATQSATADSDDAGASRVRVSAGAAVARRRRRGASRVDVGWRYLQIDDLEERRPRVRCGAEARTEVVSGARRAGLCGAGAGATTTRRSTPSMRRSTAMRIVRAGARRPRPGAAGAEARRRRAGGVRSGAHARSVADRPAQTRRGACASETCRTSSSGAEPRRRQDGSTRRARAYERAIALSPDSAFLYRELGSARAARRQHGPGARAPAARHSSSTQRRDCAGARSPRLLEARRRLRPARGRLPQGGRDSIPARIWRGESRRRQSVRARRGCRPSSVRCSARRRSRAAIWRR